MSTSIPIAVLMCHAPIVLPEVGGRRSRECAATTDAMVAVAGRLVATAPDVLVIVSPHAPRQRRAWGITSDALFGDFGGFGAPRIAVNLPGAPHAAAALAREATALGLTTWDIEPRPLDHGALVPLHFVARAGYHGPTVLISLPYPWTGTEPTMGDAIRRAAAASGERWALLASGDMSHRLIPGAPAGYHPRAAAFDAALVDAVSRGDLRGASAIDRDLRELAAEDAVDSVAVAGGAVGWDATGHQTLCYEGPFGVGYMEAVLHESPA